MDYWDDYGWLDEPTQKIIKEEPKYSYDKANCTYHYWIKYEGLRIVDYYCQYCGAKQPIK